MQQNGAVALPTGLRSESVAAAPVVVSGRPVRPTVRGKFLTLGGKRLWIKGVTYGTFRPNDEDHEPYPPLDQVRRDFARMREAGINAVRLYTPPSDRLAEAALEAELYLLPDFCWGPRRCELDDPDRLRFIFDWTRQHTRRLAQHPAILLHSIGNEIPPLLVRWYGRERIEGFLRELHTIVKTEQPDALVTYVNHPPTEYLNLPFLDVVTFNIYLEREPEFRAYLARLQMLAGERPLFLGEIGLDASRHGEVTQAKFLDWQLRAVFEKGLCGAAVYGWTDEWGIFGTDIEGWAFGLTTHDRTPKMALTAVSHIYHSGIYKLRQAPWPLVSVVVAVCNGERTINDCLAALSRLNYPNYEVIVIDDGSADDTAQIIARHGVRCIHVPNGGLSRARNLGIDAARGSIIAFIDSDAYADPDWLYYIVTALDEQNAAGAGGPNLSPPEDGFIAQCVEHAPGNPTHVLLNDEHAEHIPGCNMAFRKETLEQIGTFDPTHRAAGDDVDVCWKVQARGEKLAFSPSAVVWHHRRATIRGFLRQQKGYGFAEAHLKHRYPGRYNLFGYPVWRGDIYAGAHAGLRREGLPLLFRSRVYQGRFCGAQFQSIYQPFLLWWFQIFTTIEWQLVTACAVLAGLLGLMDSPAMAAGPLVVGAGLFALLLGAAAVAGGHACRAKNWRGRDWVKGFLVVSFLHIAQPVARAAGRLRGWWQLRGETVEFPACDRVYGNLTQREVWLERLEKHLTGCGWICRPSSDWDAADLDILGPGPYRLQLCSLYEEDLERNQYYVRYRITATMKPALPVILALLALTIPVFVVLPHLLPLAVPAVALLRCFLRARRTMVRSVAHLAREIATPLGMTTVEQYH